MHSGSRLVVGSEEAEAAGTIFAESVISGQSSAGSTPGVGLTGNVGASTGGGQCEISGYPRPANVQNLGLAWCPATVDFQARIFALQAAGAQCATSDGRWKETPNSQEIRRRLSENRQRSFPTCANGDIVPLELAELVESQVGELRERMAPLQGRTEGLREATTRQNFT